MPELFADAEYTNDYAVFNGVVIDWVVNDAILYLNPACCPNAHVRHLNN